jgi:3-methyladenine DNA glycosylase AlkD
MTVQTYVARVVSTFESHRDENEAIPMRAYMKNQFYFLGIRTPNRKQITKQLLNEVGIPNYNDFSAVIHQLWDLHEREFQYFGLSILRKISKQFKLRQIELLEHIITHKSWWDTVDEIARHLVGLFFTQFPEQMAVCIEKWLSSNNMWLQRTAILCQLDWKHLTNEKMLYDTIEKCLHSNEFFIRKAIGWALREYSKTNPQSVAEYVLHHPDLSGLSSREAMRIILRTSVRLSV